MPEDHRLLGSISPNFIVRDFQTSMRFYVDALGFEVRYQAPEEDPFIGIVGREGVMIFLKAIDERTMPQPNSSRHEWARWDAYVFSPDPHALAEDFSQRGHVSVQASVNSDNLLGFELKDADGYVLFFGRPV